MCLSLMAFAWLLGTLTPRDTSDIDLTLCSDFLF